MLEHLFGSKTRLKVLKTFFQHPGKPFFVRELTRMLDTQINAVRREIEILLTIGLIQEVKHELGPDDTAAGARLRKYYSINVESLLYPEMHALLLKGQLLGQQEFVEALKQRAGKIKLLLLTGRFTGDKRAESDLLLVGSADERSVARLIASYEKELGFDIRYTILTEKEFADRQYVMDKFLYSLFESKHVRVVDLLTKEE